MMTYKCAYCGLTGNTDSAPRTKCISNRSSHAWRKLSENRIRVWKCRKCGKTTLDDQTPMSSEGGECFGNVSGGKTHTWDRQ